MSSFFLYIYIYMSFVIFIYVVSSSFLSFSLPFYRSLFLFLVIYLCHYF